MWDTVGEREPENPQLGLGHGLYRLVLPFQTVIQYEPIVVIEQGQDEI